MPAMTRESDRARRVVQALVLVVAMAAAFLGGMLVERLQSHEERDAMLRRYEQALREHRARVMEAEKRGEEITRKP
jgi:membrane protein implicated in regulation of membrane protease activity